MAADNNPWSAEHWDPAAQAAYIRSKGMQRAMIRAREAGTTPHGPRPESAMLKALKLKKHRELVRGIVHRRNATRGVFISANMDLGFDAFVDSRVSDVAYDFGFTMSVLLDREIDIILNPGELSFAVRFLVGFDESMNGFGATYNFDPIRFDLGVSPADPIVITREKRLGPFTFNLGIAETASMGNERIMLPIDFSLGFTQGASRLTDFNVPVSFALGFNEAALPETGLTASMALGFAENVTAVELARELSAAFALGFREQAVEGDTVAFSAAFDLGVSIAQSFSDEVHIAASAALGFTEAASVYRARELSAAFSLGLTQTTGQPVILISAHPSLGFDQSTATDEFFNIISHHDLGLSFDGAPLTQPTVFLTANEALGFSLAATVDRYPNPISTHSLGLTMGAFISGTRELPSDMQLGFDMAVALTLPLEIGPFDFDVGPALAVTFSNEQGLTAVPDVGLSMSASLQALTAAALVLSKTDDDALTTSGNSGNSTTLLEGFGAADPTRWILCAIGNTTGRTLNSATIAGVTATILVQAVGARTSALIIAKVPSGTSGNVVLNWSGSPGSIGIVTYQILAPFGISIATAQTSSGTGSSSYSATIGNDAGACGVQTAIASNGAGGQDFTFSETDDYDASVGTNTFGSASHSFTGFENRVWSVSIDHGGSLNAWTVVTLGPEMDVSSIAVDLGISMAATLTTEPTNNIPSSGSIANALGFSMSVSPSYQFNLTPAPALGFDMAVTMTLGDPLSALTFLQSSATVTGTGSASFTSQNIGTGASNRWILACITTSGTPDFTGCTIGGVTATLLAGADQVSRGSAIYAANVPSGSTATVTVTYTAVSQTCQCHLFSLTGGLSTTPVDSIVKNGGGATSHSLATANGGVALGVAGGVSNANTFWGGDFNINDVKNNITGGGQVSHKSTLNTGATLSVTSQTNGSITSAVAVSLKALP